MYTIEDLLKYKIIDSDNSTYDISTELNLQNHCKTSNTIAWTDYSITAYLQEDNNLIMKIRFIYRRDDEAVMFITISNNTFRKAFSKKIFDKHLRRYIHRHIESQEEDYDFYGKDLIIDFYNEVLQDTERRFEKVTLDDI